MSIYHRDGSLIYASGEPVREALRGALAAEIEVSGADLAGADVHGANLPGADLREADLTGADLIEAVGYPSKEIQP